MLLTILLPFIAVLIGILIALYFRQKIFLGMKLILAFSGSFLLSIIVIDILPHLYENNAHNPGIWIMAGIVLQILLELFSKGIEHGHSFSSKNNKLPFVLIISLYAHAFIEGMPLNNQFELLIGVIIHKIPIGMVLAILLWEIKIPVYQKILTLFIFTCMTPLGSIVKETFFNINSSIHIINALVVGILLHISTTIIFESSGGHVFNIRKFLAILSGILLAFII